MTKTTQQTKRSLIGHHPRPLILSLMTLTLLSVAACGGMEPGDPVTTHTADLDIISPDATLKFDSCCQDADGDGDFDSCGKPITVLGKKTCSLGYKKADCNGGVPDECEEEKKNTDAELDIKSPVGVLKFDSCCQDADGDGDFDSCGKPITVLGHKTCTLGYKKADCNGGVPDDCKEEKQTATIKTPKPGDRFHF